MVGLFSSVEGIMKKLDAALAVNTAKGHASCFFVGNGATVPDFHAWELFDQLEVYSKRHSLPSPVAPHVALAKFHREFSALPKCVGCDVSMLSLVLLFSYTPFPLIPGMPTTWPALWQRFPVTT